jgi:hypothetical protein
MKYLKRFFESSEKLYTSPEFSKYFNSRGSIRKNIKYDPFNNWELDTLFDTLEEYGILDYKQAKPFGALDNEWDTVEFYNKDNKTTIIKRLIDDWYLVYDSGKSKICYECDQMDGLIDCLKDNYLN